MPEIHEPKKYHYIPAFYLKKWVRPEADDKLIEFRKLQDGRIVVKEPSERATGYRRLLYSRSTADPVLLDHSLESKYMSRLDDSASKVLSIFLSSGLQNLTAEQRTRWAKFMLVLMMRSPEEMDANVESFKVSSELAAEEHNNCVSRHA